MSRHVENAICGICTVKSIITIILVFVFAYLTIMGRVSENNFMTVFSTVIAFYYGTQYRKMEGGVTNDKK